MCGVRVIILLVLLLFLLEGGEEDEEKDGLEEKDMKEGMGSYNNKRYDKHCL